MYKNNNKYTHPQQKERNQLNNIKVKVVKNEMNYRPRR